MEQYDVYDVYDVYVTVKNNIDGKIKMEYHQFDLEADDKINLTNLRKAAKKLAEGFEYINISIRHTESMLPVTEYSTVCMGKQLKKPKWITSKHWEEVKKLRR